jgi:hypothetical protein
MVDAIIKSQKIVKSFILVGFNETKLKKYEDDTKTQIYVQNIDIVKKSNNGLIKSDEKW